MLLIVIAQTSHLNRDLLAQQAASQEDTDIVIRNIDGLIALAREDILRAIEEKKIKDRVAITDVKVFDYIRSFQRKLTTYVTKSFEGMYHPERYFRFIGSAKSLNRAKIKGSKLELGFDENLTEMANFAAEQGASGYAIINLVIEGKRTKITLTVRQIEDNEIIWQGIWERINYEKYFFLQVGGIMGVNLDLEHFPLYVSLLGIKRSYGFFEWGFYFNLGATFFIYYEGRSKNQMTVYHTSGVKIGLEVFDLAKLSYFGMELLPTIRSGLRFSYITLTNLPIRKKLEFGLIMAPGISMIFDRNYVIDLEFDIGDFAFYAGVAYRF